MSLNFSQLLQPVPEHGVFELDDYYVWGGSMVAGDDGRCHLYYSRWPREVGFASWVTHSEIAHAVADSALGEFRHRDVALPARGRECWDGLCTHNPQIQRYDGRYYLYHMGNTGDGEVVRQGLNWVHRNQQRVGVAVADSPDGPWQRFDEPIIGPTPGFYDALACSNPSCTQRPDGGYLLVYKAIGDVNPLPFGGPVYHCVATSDSPTGPFEKHPEPVFTKPSFDFVAEDPYVWCDGERYWAIVKDNQGEFTGSGKSTALFESADGLRWDLSDPPLVATTEVTWADGSTTRLEALERPQVYFAAGQPSVLLFAATGRNPREHSFNVRIPLASVR